MLLRSLDNWKDLENSRGLLYVIQRLEELTFPYSLDSYKSPTMSVQALISEALDILRESPEEDLENASRVSANIANILDEVKFRLHKNFIAKSVSSLDLEDLVAHKRDHEKLGDVSRRLFIALSELNSHEYFHEIVAEISCRLSDGRKKKDLDFLAREFVSFLQFRKVSRDHIQSMLIEHFWGDFEVVGGDSFKAFCGSVYPHMHNFCVIFGVSEVFSSFDHTILERVKAIILHNDENIFHQMEDIGISDEFAEEIICFKEKFPSYSICLVVEEATDYNSAVLSARRKIEGIFSFFRVFSHKEEMKLSKSALVEQGCCTSVRKEVIIPNNTMHFIRDMRRVKASSAMRRYINEISLDIGPDRHKFSNVVNIHGMSLESTSPDIQIVNLWTCMETLAPSDRSASKINNVVNRVTPVLMLGYYNRIVVQNLFDILRWNRRALTESLSMMPDGHGDDLKAKFISLLSVQECSDARSYLFQSFGDFSLLIFRTASIAELLSQKDKALERIEMHEKLVKWQLHRIYRSRNRIVHAGESNEYNKYLVENAHDFFDQTLLFCLELSAWKGGFSTFLSCFDYAEKQYNAYRSALRNGSGSVVWQLAKYRDHTVVFDS